MSSFDNPDYRVLPLYSPSSPAPSYCCEPGHDEQTLQHTPRRFRPLPSGSYIKKSSKITVVLDNQEDGLELPKYGRRGLVRGTVFLDDSSSISEVKLLVDGKIESTDEGGPRSKKLMNDEYELWANEDDRIVCPTQLSFSCILPSTYDSRGETRQLPPSYHAPYMGTSSLYVKCHYYLTIMVTTHRRVIGLWKKAERVTIPFNYYPRTRSHVPIVQSPCFFSSVKTLPEEWYQSCSTMYASSSSKVEPIHSNLFIPAGRTYAFSDIIPFHVQLTGFLPAFRALLPLSDSDHIPSKDFHRFEKSPSKKTPTIISPIRVFLLRQTSVETGGTKIWRDTVIGEGILQAVPPRISNSSSPPSDLRETHLDWRGEVKCNENVVVGGFTAENVAVKDFIVLLLSPSNPLTSPLLELKHATAIRLVTDSWIDVTEPDERQ